MKIIGAMFCDVIDKQFVHLSPSVSLRYHQSSAAAPIFNKSEVMIA
jgi:hypothetical protein